MIHPYQPIRQLAEKLYCVDGEWAGSPLKRRMTLIQVSGGDLVIHSPIRLRDEDR